MTIVELPQMSNAKTYALRKEGKIWISYEVTKDEHIYMMGNPSKRRALQSICDRNPGTDLLYVIIPQSVKPDR